MKKIIFMGTPDFSVPILNRLIAEAYEIVLVVTQPDRPKGRKRVLTPSPVKEAALKHGLPVFQPEKLSKEMDTILDMEVDMVITAAYGQLLPKEILNHPKYGCINVHASLLPELRGGAPIHYAILEGKEETGITIMYMAEKLDAGDIISQRRLIINQEDHVGILHDELSSIGADLLLDTLPSIFKGENERIKQDDSRATFASNISREQEKIDWTRSSHALYNQVRGLHPWPVAYTIHEGKRMKVWWATLNDRVFPDSEPGQIVAIDEAGFVTVACGDQQGLSLKVIQPAGKKKIAVKDFLKGNPDFFKLKQQLG